MLRVRHQAEDVALSVRDACDVRDCSVRILARLVPEHDLGIRFELGEEVRVSEPAPFAVLDGDRQRLAVVAPRGETRIRLLNAESNVTADEVE